MELQVPLEQYAAITALLNTGYPRDAVLERIDLPLATWDAGQVAWLLQLAQEVHAPRQALQKRLNAQLLECLTQLDEGESEPVWLLAGAPPSEPPTQPSEPPQASVPPLPSVPPASVPPASVPPASVPSPVSSRMTVELQPFSAVQRMSAAMKASGVLPFVAPQRRTGLPFRASERVDPPPSARVQAILDAALPFVPAPRLSLEQFASLAAELAVRPDDRAAIEARYGFEPAAYEAEMRTWRRIFERDPEQAAAYQVGFERYCDWLANPNPDP